MIRSITYDMDEGLTIEVDAGDQVRLIQHASAPDSVFYAVVAYPPRSEGQVEQPVLRSPTHRLLPDGSAIPVSGFGPEGEYVAYDPLDPTRWVRVGTVNEPYGPVEPQEGYVNRVQMVDLWWLLRRETRWWYGERSIPIPGSTALAAHPSTVLDTIRASLGAAMVSAFFPDPVGAKVSLRVEAPSVGGLLQFLTRWEAILLESGFVFNSVTEGGRARSP